MFYLRWHTNPLLTSWCVMVHRKDLAAGEHDEVDAGVRLCCLRVIVSHLSHRDGGSQWREGSKEGWQQGCLQEGQQQLSGWRPEPLDHALEDAQTGCLAVLHDNSSAREHSGTIPPTHLITVFRCSIFSWPLLERPRGLSSLTYHANKNYGTHCAIC